MTRMISDLMDAANIHAGRISVKPRREPIDTIIHEAVSVYEPLANTKNISLTMELPDGDLHSNCDRERIMQVLANVIGNSIKFCDSGDSIVVTAARKAAGVEVTITDSGPGIAAADLPQVFDAYWSANENLQRGTGLGLFITKRIVEAHGGAIWIESAVSEGTRVHFTLPC